MKYNVRAWNLFINILINVLMFIYKKNYSFALESIQAVCNRTLRFEKDKRIIQYFYN